MKKIFGFFGFCAYILTGILPVTVFASSDCTGGTITHSGGNTIHTFLSSGSLVCGDQIDDVSYLVVGGGGGGGGQTGGGGGAGGFRTGSGYSVTGSVSVTVGLGGSGGVSNNGVGSDGGNSIFGTITSLGGGGGGANDSAAGNSGGSGGGAGATLATFGTGTSGQGNDGGSSGTSPNKGGGGGGGSSSTGVNGTNSGTITGGAGGAGTASGISGSLVTYAGGGGGGGFSGLNGSGGNGGGGNGGNFSGTANTGGGGGGSSDNGITQAGNGGSGIVIISYTTPIPAISGTLNRLAKFTSSTTISNALFSDDGVNTTLTSGNLFMPVNSVIDSITNGTLSFGVATSTTMTFGRSGQNMVINSKVGIGTSTPTSTLHVIGDIFANFINILANGFGIDTSTAGALSIGSTTATSITIGRTNATTTISGPLKVTNLNTVSNCNSTTTPSVCGSALSGSIAMPIGGSTVTVNTTAVTANSQIFVQEDFSLGSRLGITCNTTTGRIYTISARVSTSTPSFTIKSSANPTTNKACLSYFIVN